MKDLVPFAMELRWSLFRCGSFLASISILAGLMIPEQAFAVETDCKSLCKRESHTTAIHLLEGSTSASPLAYVLTEQEYPYIIFVSSVEGPIVSQFSDAESNGSSISIRAIDHSQGSPIVLALRQDSPQLHPLPETALPPYPLEQSEVLISAPQNLNPGLYIPLFEPEDFNEDLLDSDASDLVPEEDLENSGDEISGTEDSDSGLFNYLSTFKASGLELDYQQNFDNFGGFEYGAQPTLNFENDAGDRIGLTTGVEIFDQATTAQVTNVPFDVSWHRKIGDSSVDVSAGVDFFNRLSMAPRLSAGGATPVWEGATLSGVIEYAPYKFNAQTLENEIRALRFGPNLFWQITPSTSLFSLVRFGAYNDGNTEQQSFSRLEQRIGPFGVAANLFNWVYRSNAEMSSGYFSPQDFLVYSGEIFWADTLFNALDCRASASSGQQRLGGSWTSGYSYGGQCAIPITKNITLDVNYAFSNVRDQMTGESAFNNSTLTSGLRVDF